MGFSRIAELAASIKSNTDAVDQYHISRGLPPRSFKADAPLFTPYPPEIDAQRQAALDATYELHRLLIDPVEICKEAASYGSAALQIITRRKIALSFLASETAIIAQIAEKAGLKEQTARRVLRNASSTFIFKEVEPGVIAHTPASRALVEIPHLAAWVNFVADDIWQPTTGGWNVVKRETDSYFKVIGRDPQHAEQFKDAMALFMTLPAMSPDFILQGFDFNAYKDATVVDIGGSHGVVATTLAKAYPRMRVIVQDLPEVVEIGPAGIPKELSERVTYMGHDFFEELPVKDAKIYYMRWILHDWADKYAIDILRNIVPALKPGDWMLINEMCYPPVGAISARREKWIRAFDLAMIGFQNSHERDREEWEALFAEADPRFKLRDVVIPKGSDLAMINVQWTG